MAKASVNGHLPVVEFLVKQGMSVNEQHSVSVMCLTGWYYLLIYVYIGFIRIYRRHCISPARRTTSKLQNSSYLTGQTLPSRTRCAAVAISYVFSPHQHVTYRVVAVQNNQLPLELATGNLSNKVQVSLFSLTYFVKCFVRRYHHVLT